MGCYRHLKRITRVRMLIRHYVFCGRPLPRLLELIMADLFAKKIAEKERREDCYCVRELERRGLGVPEEFKLSYMIAHREKKTSCIGRARGSESGGSKLTEESVLKIRALYAAGGVTSTKLGIDFGVSRQAIMYIVKRVSWTHI